MNGKEEQNVNEPVLIGEVPDGAEAFLASDIALETDKPIIFVARDDKRLARAVSLFKFRMPEAEILRLRRENAALKSMF